MLRSYLRASLIKTAFTLEAKRTVKAWWHQVDTGPRECGEHALSVRHSQWGTPQREEGTTDVLAGGLRGVLAEQSRRANQGGECGTEGKEARGRKARLGGSNSSGGGGFNSRMSSAPALA